jgi:hypothetical protein
MGKTKMTQQELNDSFDETLDEVTELVKIGNLTYTPSEVLKKVDPIAYRVSVDEHADWLLEDNPDLEIEGY